MSEHLAKAISLLERDLSTIPAYRDLTVTAEPVEAPDSPRDIAWHCVPDRRHYSLARGTAHPLADTVVL